MKLLLVILEGQLYLAGVVAIFAAEIAFLAWGLWSRRPILGLLAVFVTLPLIRTTVAAIRACFVRVRPPEGLTLDRAAGRALFDVVDDVRRAVRAPAVDHIVITGAFVASAAAYSPAWRLRKRRTLVLGLPVLTTLSAEEFRAVVAHELAHFSSAHDRYGAWVYRTRGGWLALRAALDARLATPVYVYWLLRWYVPRLDAASAEVSRRHEFAADAVAATVTGSRAVADALVAFEAGARYADDTFWPAIGSSHEVADEPPRPYTQMLTWNARIASGEALDAVVASDEGPSLTHPSLRDRLTRLNEPARVPPVPERLAGQDILGDGVEGLAAALDADWLARYADRWTGERRQHVERRATLDRLTALDAPSADELFARADLLEDLSGADRALPVYLRAAEQGHAAASLAAGRIHLDRMDLAGILLVETAIDRDEALVPAGCRILADYYRRTGQLVAARKCEWRATGHETRERLAAPHPLTKSH
jgi:Zn-dependent protease with chaperone function